MVLMAPRDENELRHMLKAAVGYGRPAAIRFPKGEVAGVAMERPGGTSRSGKRKRSRTERTCSRLRKHGPSGPRGGRRRRSRPKGLSLAVVDAKFAKPLDEEMILRYARAGRTIVTVEEGVPPADSEARSGSFSTATGSTASGSNVSAFRSSIFPVGKLAQLRERYGLDADGLAAQFRAFFGGGAAGRTSGANS